MGEKFLNTNYFCTDLRGRKNTKMCVNVLTHQEKLPSMNKIPQKIPKILFVGKVIFYYNIGGV